MWKLTASSILDAIKLRAKVFSRTFFTWVGFGGGLYLLRYLSPSGSLLRGETLLWVFILGVAFMLTYRTEMLTEKLASR
jgi:hypothetical protein